MHLQATAYTQVHNFYIKSIRYSCLLDDKYKFNADVSDITNKAEHFSGCVVQVAKCLKEDWFIILR